jgi:hypothetical protein
MARTLLGPTHDSVSEPSIVFGSPPPTLIATLRGLRHAARGNRAFFVRLGIQVMYRSAKKGHARSSMLE